MANELAVIEETQNQIADTKTEFGKLAPKPLPEELKVQLQNMVERDQIINDWIRQRMVKGVHYDQLLMGGRKSDWFVTKSGCHRIMEDFLWFPDYRIDEEARKQFSNTDNLICYLCVIYDHKGRYVASGRGAARVGKDGADENSTIKKAQKRAMQDAIKASSIMSNLSQIAEEGKGTNPLDEAIRKSPTNCTCGTKNQYHALNCPLHQ